MTDHLSRDLQEVKRHVLDMGALAEEALRLALSAYKNREEVPARKLRETASDVPLLDEVGLLVATASAEPPRIVKSSPLTTTVRPSILPRPMTQLLGE